MTKQNHKEEKPDSDFANQKLQNNGFLIVGLGASAGGIQAFQDFFSNLPEDSGMAYVVILHLSPDHDSKLAQVLQMVSKIPVTQVTEKVQITPNHVYVVPPNQHLTMEDCFIIVSPNISTEDRRAPIDIFFRTLADQHGPRAVCVVLSGTGANGSMGLKRIKERGGAAFVENPREAQFNEMPRNSIATDLVDEVLNVAEIPAKIIAYRDSLNTVQIVENAEKRPEDQQQALREIFTNLKVRTGHDFSNYKRPTLLRRIERRINVHGLPDLPAYAKYIQDNKAESTALLKDLLISVTNFFRDKKAFDMLEQEILPVLFTGKKFEDQVRIWVAGCATGEEAYSIAMLCTEKISGSIDAPKIQIFATDIDDTAIATGRAGLYSINDLADVSPERLHRFFTKEGDCFRIKREVRETVMFANHNFLKDPAFSRLDLVSCRNVLIYLNHIAQERAIQTFHFALNPTGFLLLGNSESVDGATDLFATYTHENHIFQRRQVTPRSYPVPESVPHFAVNRPRFADLSQIHENKALERISFADLHQQLLEEYAPPSLIVNEEYDILHLTEKAGRYLQITGGEISKNLLQLVKPQLRLELRSTLYQATQRKSPVEVKGVKVTIDNDTEIINIHARPVLRPGDAARGFILVLFEPASGEEKPGVLLASDEPITKQLEEELARLKVQLNASGEQHEFQAEELKASNEELQAMNEELRSASEELETSKEELQSINEELLTVNQELKIKIEETSLSSNNLQNLINSAGIGTVFLDRSFRVVLFTPAARSIFNLIPGDYGRPLSDITHKLDYNELQQDVERVLDDLSITEREVKTKDGRIFLMRVLPYRTTEDHINGLVITFVDITKLKTAEEALRISEERLRVTVDTATDYAIINLNKEGLIEGWNGGAQRIFEYKPEEIIGKPGAIIFTPEDRAADVPEKEMKTAREEGRAPDERWHIRSDGSRFYLSGVMRPIYNPELTGYVKVARDMTEQKLLEQQKDDFIGIASHELKTPITSIKAYTEMLREMYGEANEGKGAEMLIKLDEQVDRLIELMRSLLNTTVLSAGRILLSTERFNISELINQQVSDLKPTIKNHVIKLVLEEDLFVTADKRRIGEVITNLVSNAIKYSPNGRDIIITSKKINTEVEVCIKDYGIGVPEDMKDKIFERFFRVPTTQIDTFPGLGLGLYISATIVQMHKGKIWVNSKLNKGALFCFTLPES